MTTNPKTEQAVQTILKTPEGQAAFKNGSPFGSLGRVLTLALHQGLLQPADLDPQHYAVDQSGNVHTNEGIPPLAQLAIAGIGTAVGGSLIAGLGAGGSGGAAVAGQTPADWAAGSTAVGGAGGAGVGGSLLSKFGTPNSLETIGKGLGAFSQAQANNRGAGNDDTSRYDQTRIAAQTARAQDETQSLKHLSQTGYILGGGSTFKPPSPTINGHTYDLPDLGLGPAPITPEMKAGAGDLQGQLLGRLKPGGTVTPTPPQTKPGFGENLGNFGSLIASGIGFGKSIFGK